MTNDIWEQRRQQLQDAMRKAVLDLLEHMNGADGFEVKLDEGRWVRVERRST